MITAEQTFLPPMPQSALLFSLAKYTIETHPNRLNNALLLEHVHDLNVLLGKKKKEKKKEPPFFPLILVHMLGHIVIPDAFHFLQHSWERCFLNLCAYPKYANFM